MDIFEKVIKSLTSWEKVGNICLKLFQATGLNGLFIDFHAIDYFSFLYYLVGDTIIPHIVFQGVFEVNLKNRFSKFSITTLSFNRYLSSFKEY